MSEIVGAFAVSHILAGWQSVEAQAERVFAGMQEVGRRVQAANPDLLVIISSDHMANFAMGLQAPFAVGGADEYTGLGDMDLPRLKTRGHPEFAESFIAFAADAGFDLAKAEDVRPDHGVMIPRLFADPKGRLPIVPVYINIHMEPVPQTARCWRLGQALRNFVLSRPQRERVVVLATGGLSHWIFTPEMGQVNEAFDRDCLQRLASGEAESLAQMSAGQIAQRAGNGGLELLNWICMAGSAAASSGEIIFYEPMTKWATGLGGIALHVDGQKGGTK